MKDLALVWNRIRYGLYAGVYDAVVTRTVFVSRGRQRSLTLAGAGGASRVLLVAAGTGLDLELLSPESSVAACDISPAMLRQLRRRAQVLDREVSVSVMDAAHLGFPDAAFDCVVLHLALAVVPDPEATIREVARVLGPGGRVAIFDKFLPDGARPGVLRRLLNLVTALFFSDINRRLGPLLRAAGLTLRASEPVALGGSYVAACAERELST